MSHDQERSRRTATTQAGIVIAVLVIALALAGFFALRDTGRAAGSLAEKARELLQREPEPTVPVEIAAPPDAGTSAATPDTAGDTSMEPTALQDAVAACIPTLRSLSESVRIVAVDASVSNVDFVQESASTPQLFIRLGCEWTGNGWNYTDNGRMVVPPMVGDRATLPATLVDRNSLTPEFYTKQIQAAVSAAREPGMLEVTRVEVSYVDGHGVLTRVRMKRSAGPLDIVLDERGDPQPQTTPFPQVERMAGVTEEEAQRGFRDQGQVLWTVGAAESVDRLHDDYFSNGERLHALELRGRQVMAYLASGKGPVRVVAIDEYGDLAERDPESLQPGQCARPFTARDARTAMDNAMRARGETLAQFEAREFDTAIIDCAENPRTPAWRFGGG